MRSRLLPVTMSELSEIHDLARRCEVGPTLFDETAWIAGLKEILGADLVEGLVGRGAAYRLEVLVKG
jgi:hypothetical protein